MTETTILYDDTEHTTTRFVGFTGDFARFDIAITTTSHFFGKKLVHVIQSGRSAIMNDDDAENIPYVMNVFNINNEEEALEFSQFLVQNL